MKFTFAYSHKPVLKHQDNGLSDLLFYYLLNGFPV